MLAGGVSNDTLDALSNLIQTLKTDDSGSASSGGTSDVGASRIVGGQSQRDISGILLKQLGNIFRTAHDILIRVA